ncbi:hypothetical protein [Adlercreutzia aquisgranensis]|uniref:Molybdopterin-binding protein n=1 Tax=Muribaculaceae bacterium Z82 TaxID=2304548 RepID=A0A7C9NZW6_9BACT|nr:hypothetical protein [Adlercreutzia aquisgranensis]
MNSGNVHHVGQPIVFEGYLDDFDNGVAAVQFSLDDGVSWTDYDTSNAVAEAGLSWRFVYTPEEAGCYLLKVRAKSRSGAVSPLVSGFAFEVLP